jgi:hypothetical protein
MLQARQHLRLEFEAPKRTGAGHTLAHELDGHGASGIFLLRLVDAAHAARPDQALDLIVADHGALGDAHVAAERYGRRAKRALGGVGIPWPRH